jgi:hypothetical protein
MVPFSFWTGVLFPFSKRERCYACFHFSHDVFTRLVPGHRWKCCCALIVAVSSTILREPMYRKYQQYLYYYIKWEWHSLWDRESIQVERFSTAMAPVIQVHVMSDCQACRIDCMPSLFQPPSCGVRAMHIIFFFVVPHATRHCSFLVAIFLLQKSRPSWVVTARKHVGKSKRRNGVPVHIWMPRFVNAAGCKKNE